MSRGQCQAHFVLRTFEFSQGFEAADKNPSKSLRAAEKSQENIEELLRKVEAKCTGFSAEFFDSQSVEMFCFARKTKIQMLTTSSRSLTRIHQGLLKSLGLYVRFVYKLHVLTLSSKGVFTFLPIGT